MTSVAHRPSAYRTPELGRRLVGTALELAIKAYGAAAAVSVVSSDAETVGGKVHDAVAAVPNLAERYRDATYVVEHREEIQAALDHARQHAPDSQELEAAARESSETLVGIDTTYSEVLAAKEAIANRNPFEGVPEAYGHLDNAWDARPDLGSLRELAEVAERVGPFVDQVDVLAVPRLYGGLLTVADNLASDEVAATLGVMAAAVALAFVVGTGVGFWARRGRPGVVAHLLQRCGARLFGGWYARNLEFALGRPLHAVARRRFQDDVVADPEAALDPEALERLESYFARRLEARARS